MDEPLFPRHEEPTATDVHPVRLRVDDDLVRNRWTVGFRLILAIPHLIWVSIWTVIVAVVAIVAWIWALCTGRLPAGLHRFFSSYVSYVTQLTAYLTIAANPYPTFNGERGYPVEIDLPEHPERQSRWRILFRGVLALPTIFLAAILGGVPSGSVSAGGGSASTEGGGGSVGGAIWAMAFLGWFATLATGRMPKGLRDGAVYGTGYRAQAFAYLLLLTDRYPNADPAPLLETVDRPPLHAVRVASDDDDLRRSRVTVLFRLPLAIPHIVWFVLWTALVVLASIVQWAVTLVRGTPAAALHRFLSAYVRYGFHLSAFITLASNPFPGFTGAPGTYPLDVALPPPARQNRWKTAFRGVLGVPALIIGSALGGAWIVCAILTWFTGLFLGRAPRGLHELLVYALRYDAQTYAYLYFVTDAYPHASPLEGAQPPEPAADELVFAQA